jgi:hypothetical protein
MPTIIKVRCNGPEKHINEVDIDKALRSNVILRGGPAVQQIPAQQSEMPERIILNCQFCTEGKVILTRDMIQENL